MGMVVVVMMMIMMIMMMVMIMMMMMVMIKMVNDDDSDEIGEVPDELVNIIHKPPFFPDYLLAIWVKHPQRKTYKAL